MWFDVTDVKPSLLLLVPFPETGKFVRLSPSECEFRLDFGRLVRLYGLHRRTDGQTDKSSENLFVPFSNQTICPSETICPSRQFARLLLVSLAARIARKEMSGLQLNKFRLNFWSSGLQNSIQETDSLLLDINGNVFLFFFF